MDALPTWTVSLTDAVPSLFFLRDDMTADYGIWPYQTVTFTGRCLQHGQHSLEVTTRRVAKYRYIPCSSCHAMGITRWLPIEDYTLVK